MIVSCNAYVYTIIQTLGKYRSVPKRDFQLCRPNPPDNCLTLNFAKFVKQEEEFYQISMSSIGADLLILSISTLKTSLYWWTAPTTTHSICHLTWGNYTKAGHKTFWCPSSRIFFLKRSFQTVKTIQPLHTPLTKTVKTNSLKRAWNRRWSFLPGPHLYTWAGGQPGWTPEMVSVN